ncbi:ammonium transporter, partial [Bacillus spizizenii]|nr:ammonium transporter [Bacillus spizizenii]
DGLFYGDASLNWKQIVAIAATYVFVFIVTIVIIKIVGLFLPLRATEEEESLGLDLSRHGEKAYQDSM